MMRGTSSGFSYLQHEEPRQQKGQACQGGKHVAPGEIVKVRIKQPVAVPAVDPEDGHGDEETEGTQHVAGRDESAEVVLKAEGHLQGVPEEQNNRHQETREGEDEGQGDKQLNHHQPPYER